jgi:hypothetical protein
MEEDAEDDDDDDGTDEESQSSGKLQSLFDKYENDPIVNNRSRNSLDYQPSPRNNHNDTTTTAHRFDMDDPRETFRQSRVLASLKSLNAPSELREATALLLQSSLLDSVTAGLLNSKIMEQPVNAESSTDFIDLDDEVVEGGRGVGVRKEVRQSQIDPGGYKNLRQKSQKFTVAEVQEELDNKQLLDPTGEKKPNRDSLDYTTKSQEEQTHQNKDDNDEEYDDDKEATCEKICCSDIITTATTSTETASTTEITSYLFAPPEVTNSIVRPSIWTKH